MVGIGGKWGVSSGGTFTIANNTITTAMIQDNAITNVKMADNSVNTAEINDNAVTNAKLADNAVNTAEITDGAVTDAKLASTFSKVLDREFDQTVNTTASETTVFTHTIPANTLSTNKTLRFTMKFDYLANSGTPDITIRVKYGATTLYAGQTANFGASTSRFPGFMYLELTNRNATNSQQVGGRITIHNDNAGVTSGIGSINGDGLHTDGVISGTATVDSTASQDFVVTIQWSASSASIEFRKFAALLELV